MRLINRQMMALLNMTLNDHGCDADLFQRCEWEALRSLGQKHAVDTLLFDAVQKLPAEQKPDKSFLLQWAASTLWHEAAQKKIRRTLVQISDIFREAGVDCIVLKGPALAAIYPNPSRRVYNDIDLLLKNPGQIGTACALMEQLDAAPDPEYDIQHINYRFQGIQVELHHKAHYFQNAVMDRRFQKMLQETLINNKPDYIEIDQCKMEILPTEINVVFLLAHKMTHIYDGSFGLRQLCDWALYLKHACNAVNPAVLNTFLSSLHLKTAYRTFGSIAVRYFSLDPACLLYKPGLWDEKLGDFLLRNSFHRKTINKKGAHTLNKEFVRHKTVMLSKIISLFPLYPQEAFWWPIRKTVHFRNRSTHMPPVKMPPV